MTSAGLSESSEPLCSAVQRGHIAGAMPIVTNTYRYKPPPKRKGQKLAEITGPRIVTSVPVKKGRRTVGSGAAAEDVKGKHPLPADELAGEQQPNPPTAARKSAIVTARKLGKAIPDGLLPDTPEEHQRRGDAADAMFQEMKRRIAEKLRS